MIFQRIPENEDGEERAYPFCGQVQMVEEGQKPELVCDCHGSAAWRALVEAIEEYCGEDCGEISEEFKPVSGAALDAMRSIAGFIARGAIGGVALEIGGSTVRIGRKVSRKVSVKAECEVKAL